MRAVYIGIGHNNNLAVPQLLNVKVLADGSSQRRDHRHQLFIAVYPVDPRLFYVQHFAPEGENCLIPPVSSFLGGTACRVTLDNVQLCSLCGFFLTVCQLSGEGSAFHRRLAPCGFSGFFCCFPGILRGQALVENCPCHRRIFLKVAHELIKDHFFDKWTHRRIAQPSLGLSFKFALRQLYGNNCRQAFPHVIAQKTRAVL